MPSFEDLRIWKEAIALMKEIHDITETLPKDERYRLRDQIERSSSSVPDNIAEGYGSYYYQDKIKEMMTARKEAVETQNHVRKLQMKNYIRKSRADILISRYQSVIRGINGFANYVRRKRGNKR